MPCIQLSYILDVVVDHGVLEALAGVIENLGLHCDVLKSHFAPSIDMTFVAGHRKELLHFFVNPWQKNHILSSIFKHLLTQRPHRVPESFILLHLPADFLLLRVANLVTEILLQERIQTDLILIAAVPEALGHGADDSVRDLCVEDAITAHTVLVDQSRAILAKVMENLHNVIRREYLLQVKAQMVVKWIDSEQVENVAVLLEAQLEQGYWLALDETLAVEAENRGRIAHPYLAAEALDQLRSFN